MTPGPDSVAAGHDDGSVWVALLRGINVGGANLLPMGELRALFEQAGCRNVRTYIQSGNVFFDASPELARRLPERVTERIAGRFGLTVPVVLRSSAELGEVAGTNPFLEAGADPMKLHVMFLADRPEPGAAARLDPRRSPPDRFVLRNREIYLHCPNGVARSRLTTQYFDGVLGTTATSRSWRTVLQLVERCGASP